MGNPGAFHSLLQVSAFRDFSVSPSEYGLFGLEIVSSNLMCTLDTLIWMLWTSTWETSELLVACAAEPGSPPASRTLSGVGGLRRLRKMQTSDSHGAGKTLQATESPFRPTLPAGARGSHAFSACAAGTSGCSRRAGNGLQPSSPVRQAAPRCLLPSQRRPPRSCFRRTLGSRADSAM